MSYIYNLRMDTTPFLSHLDAVGRSFWKPSVQELRFVVGGLLETELNPGSADDWGKSLLWVVLEFRLPLAESNLSIHLFAVLRKISLHASVRTPQIRWGDEMFLHCSVDLKIRKEFQVASTASDIRRMVTTSLILDAHVYLCVCV